MAACAAFGPGGDKDPLGKMPQLVGLEQEHYSTSRALRRSVSVRDGSVMSHAPGCPGIHPRNQHLRQPSNSLRRVSGKLHFCAATKIARAYGESHVATASFLDARELQGSRRCHCCSPTPTQPALSPSTHWDRLQVPDASKVAPSLRNRRNIDAKAISTATARQRSNAWRHGRHGRRQGGAAPCACQAAGTATRGRGHQEGGQALDESAPPVITAAGDRTVI